MLVRGQFVLDMWLGGYVGYWGVESLVDTKVAGCTGRPDVHSQVRVICDVTVGIYEHKGQHGS